MLLKFALVLTIVLHIISVTDGQVYDGVRSHEQAPQDLKSKSTDNEHITAKYPARVSTRTSSQSHRFARQSGTVFETVMRRLKDTSAGAGVGSNDFIHSLLKPGLERKHKKDKVKAERLRAYRESHSSVSRPLVSTSASIPTFTTASPEVERRNLASDHDDGHGDGNKLADPLVTLQEQIEQKYLEEEDEEYPIYGYVEEYDLEKLEELVELEELEEMLDKNLEKLEEMLDKNQSVEDFESKQDVESESESGSESEYPSIELNVYVNTKTYDNDNDDYNDDDNAKPKPKPKPKPNTSPCDRDQREHEHHHSHNHQHDAKSQSQPDSELEPQPDSEPVSIFEQNLSNWYRTLEDLDDNSRRLVGSSISSISSSSKKEKDELGFQPIPHRVHVFPIDTDDSDDSNAGINAAIAREMALRRTPYNNGMKRSLKAEGKEKKDQKDKDIHKQREKESQEEEQQQQQQTSEDETVSATVSTYSATSNSTAPATSTEDNNDSQSNHTVWQFFSHMGWFLKGSIMLFASLVLALIAVKVHNIFFPCDSSELPVYSIAGIRNHHNNNDAANDDSGIQLNPMRGGSCSRGTTPRTPRSKGNTPRSATPRDSTIPISSTPRRSGSQRGRSRSEKESEAQTEELLLEIEQMVAESGTTTCTTPMFWTPEKKNEQHSTAAVSNDSSIWKVWAARLVAMSDMLSGKMYTQLPNSGTSAVAAHTAHTAVLQQDPSDSSFHRPNLHSSCAVTDKGHLFSITPRTADEGAEYSEACNQPISSITGCTTGSNIPSIYSETSLGTELGNSMTAVTKLNSENNGKNNHTQSHNGTRKSRERTESSSSMGSKCSSHRTFTSWEELGELDLGQEQMILAV